MITRAPKLPVIDCLASAIWCHLGLPNYQTSYPSVSSQYPLTYEGFKIRMLEADQLKEAFEVDQNAKSRFTYRDLRDLNRFSPTCPLRSIALIDFDAFYAQCETVRLGLPEHQPLAVRQWNICIAVNYPAKAAGVKRINTPDEAKVQCPNIVIQHIATWREGDSTWAYRPDVLQHLTTDKAALDPYRLQSRKAFELIKSILPASPCQKVEKASIDEVFLDLSAQVYDILIKRYHELASTIHHSDLDSFLPLPPTTVLQWDKDQLVELEAEQETKYPDWDDVALNIASEVVRDIRQEIYNRMKYTCSAGIAHSKTTAKLAAGHNKPNKQTVVRSRATIGFLSGYKITKIRGLGGKLGRKVIEAFGTDQVSILSDISLPDMRSKLGGESAAWVYNVIRGIEYSEVVERTQLQSMLAAKTFLPKLKDLEQAGRWLRILTGDLMGRLHEQDATSNRRRPRVIALNHAIEGRFGPTRSKQMQIPLGVEIDAQLLFRLSRDLLVQISHDGPTWPCLGISISISKFEDYIKGNLEMTGFLVSRVSHSSSTAQDIPNECSSKEVVTRSTPKRKSSSLGLTIAEMLLSTKRKQCDTSFKDVADKIPTDSKKDLLPTEQHLYNCPKCSEDIDNAMVLEHLDWHVAMELQAA